MVAKALTTDREDFFACLKNAIITNEMEKEPLIVSKMIKDILRE